MTESDHPPGHHHELDLVATLQPRSSGWLVVVRALVAVIAVWLMICALDSVLWLEVAQRERVFARVHLGMTETSVVKLMGAPEQRQVQDCHRTGVPKVVLLVWSNRDEAQVAIIDPGTRKVIGTKRGSAWEYGVIHLDQLWE